MYPIPSKTRPSPPGGSLLQLLFWCPLSVKDAIPEITCWSTRPITTLCRYPFAPMERANLQDDRTCSEWRLACHTFVAGLYLFTPKLHSRMKTCCYMPFSAYRKQPPRKPAEGILAMGVHVFVAGPHICNSPATSQLHDITAELPTHPEVTDE